MALSIENFLNHPGHIFVGNMQDTAKTVADALKTMLCASKGCNKCSTCTAIQEQQLTNCLWLKPEKQYTLDDLDYLRERIQFMLEPDEHFFFIFSDAQTLSTACSNSLLKLLEEPPRGYHFLFLTTQLEALLATIRSRCLVYYVTAQTHTVQHPLLTACITLSLPSATNWLRLLEETEINELETMQLIDYAYAHWTTEYKKIVSATVKTTTKNCTRIEHILQILQAAHEQPPMPGSSKLFWKQLFLQLHTI